MTSTPTPAPRPADPGGRRRAEWVGGALAMLPLAVGYLPFGLLIGAAVARSVDSLAAWSATMPVYGGSAQLTLIELLRTGSGLWAAAGAALLINVRLVVYSSALAPLWSTASLPVRMLAAATVIDPTWMLAEQRAGRPGDPADRRAHYAGAAALLTVAWISWVSAGVVIGSRPGLTGVLGIAVPLCLIAIVAPHLRVRGGSAAVAAAVLVAYACTPLPSGAAIPAAMAAAAVAGGLVSRRAS